MRKFFGWFFLVCGVISLPNFCIKLSSEHDEYIIYGMVLGQAAIFFIAYLCLRKRTSKDDSTYSSYNSHSMPTEEYYRMKEIEYAEQHPSIAIKEEATESNDDCEIMQEDEYGTTSCQKEESREAEQISSSVIPQHCSLKYPKVEFGKHSWDDVFSFLFSSQIEELKDKCSPSRFMEQYDHDKIKSANDIIVALNAAKEYSDLSSIRKSAEDLGIAISTAQLYDYLTTLCNPTNFIGTNDEFNAANNIYSKIYNSQNDLTKLEDILYEARQSVKILPEEGINDSDSIKKPMAKSLKILLSTIAIWEIVQIFLWAYKGTLYNANKYFYPFQSTNIRKFDTTEFLVYGLAIPAIAFIIYYIIKKVNIKKQEEYEKS